MSRFLIEGHVGVTVFYVLSGFLIAWNYMDQTQDLNARFWGPDVLKRVARIQPLYLLILFVCYAWPIVDAQGRAGSPTDIFLNVTLLKGFFDGFKFSGVAQSWSLTVEETFYLSAPILFVNIRRWGFSRTQVLLWSVGMALMAVGSHLTFFGFFGGPRFVILYTFFGRSFEFLTGIYCARWLKRRKTKTKRGWAALTYAGLVGFTLSVSVMASLRGGEFVLGLFHPAGMVLNNLVLAVFLGMLLLGLAMEKSVFSWILSSRLFVLLGRSSYAFYLVHLGVLAKVLYSLTNHGSEGMHFVTFFTGITLLSVLLYVGFEHPMNVAVKQFGRSVLGIGGGNTSERGRLLRNRALTCLAAGLGLCGFLALSRARPLPAATLLTLRLRLDIPSSRELERPIGASSQFGPLTSHVEEVAGLLGSVGGVNVASKEFIFAHANSELDYELEEGKWKKLSFSMGLDDVGGSDQGSVIYIVKGDGRVLFKSGVIRPVTRPQEAAVDVSGVRKLELLVTDAGDGITSDEAYWIEPRLR